MRVVLLGPPGAGKGTQAQIIAEQLGVPAISTGDIFRANVSGGTDLGRRAKAFMDAGDLVPDEITVAMVAGRLAEADAAGGFLLDGFPRTIPQAERLDEALAEQGHRLDSVLELVVDEDEVVRRLSGRRLLVEGQWVTREDDKPETVRRRLEVYRELTAPLTAFYSTTGLLRRIDAMGEITEVTQRGLSALGQNDPIAHPRLVTQAMADSPRRAL
ncbi:adenylate kinase [Geodermatophilus sp. SYSU D00779]